MLTRTFKVNQYYETKFFAFCSLVTKKPVTPCQHNKPTILLL